MEMSWSSDILLILSNNNKHNKNKNRVDKFVHI